MNRLLQIQTSGMKNIESPLIVGFANQTIEKGPKKVNNVKGIFGYNGAGKTAFISSMFYYKRIALDSTFLVQSDTKKKLNKLINYHTKSFTTSTIFAFGLASALKHEIVLKKNEAKNAYYICFEELSLSTGRTLSGPYKPIIRQTEGEPLFIDESMELGDLASYLRNSDLHDASFLAKGTDYLISHPEKITNQITTLEGSIAIAFLNINNIDVSLMESDQHTNFIVDREFANAFIQKAKELEAQKEQWVDYYTEDTIVPKRDYEQFEKNNRKLLKFIQEFKPSLKNIVLDKREDGNQYHVRRIFVYDHYNVEYEFESSGIKHLVHLFASLLKCARGGIVFIDEIDVNLHTAYFTKLISFFKNYGKGQLIFTTHNIEAMNALKDQPRSIMVLGENQAIDTWVAKGNRSPVREYIEGYFPNSPMNVEDFDFINVFLGED